jgi:DNA-binding response OmpR family regulator
MSVLNRQRSVLIADDNRDLAKGMALLLRFAGFEVETVYDGLDALTTAAARMPDIVLLDIDLPDLTGFEVAEGIRAMSGAGNVLIIAISGYDPDMVRGSPRRSAFDYYIIKPVNMNTIIHIMSMAN